MSNYMGLAGYPEMGPSGDP